MRDAGGLDFCSGFNYPDSIRRLLEEVVGVLDKKEVVSVIALGSLPRGELSYRMEGGAPLFFSDIELMVVTGSRIRAEKKTAFFSAINGLKKSFQKASPLFDIAAEFMALQDFEALPFRVRFYELKRSGKVLFGEDIRERMPLFEARNLDRRDTNNIILRRLLSILLYLPECLIEKRRSGPAEDVFKYALARNALDIATVRLFLKGIFLPTYKEKVGYIVLHPGDFINDLGDRFPEFLTECLDIKLRMSPGHELKGLFEETIKYFRTLLFLTLRDNGVSVDNKESLSVLVRKQKTDIFGERDITRAKAGFILKPGSLNIVQKGLCAMSCSFLGGMTFFLLNMNEAACLFLKGDRRCLSVLDDSWWALTRIGILNGKEELPVTFIDRFLVLRKIFFNDFYIEFMAPGSAGHVKGILDWKYE